MKSTYVKQSLVVLSIVLTGCASESVNAPINEEDLVAVEEIQETAPEPEPGDACAEVALLTEAKFAGSCAYDNPFTKTSECRDYNGAWTEEEVIAECEKVFTGVSGTVGAEPCPVEELIGVCSAEVQESRNLTVNFYEGDPEQLASVCTQFLSGAYCSKGEGTAPATQLDPLDEAMISMISDDKVTVRPECTDDTCLAELIAQRKGISFEPATGEPVAGFVVYPGAQVDPRAYAPVARQMAIMGIKVIIVPMPGNLAITGINRAKDVITPDIEHWFIGGHSMGGAMAVRCVNTVETTPEISGIILWAAYPATSDDLSGTTMPVLSIAGSLDGVATPDEIEASIPYLPETAEIQMLEGANHAQFGTYGKQNGDLNPEMSAMEQQQLVAALSTHFIKRITLDITPDETGFLDSYRPSDMCVYGQLTFLGVDESEWGDKIKVTEHTDLNEFAESKPSLGLQGDQLDIEVQVMTRLHGNGMLPSKTSLLPGEVWCKMKTREIFEKTTGVVGSANTTDCSELNRKSLDIAKEALNSVDELSLTMGTDNSYETGMDWLKEGSVTVNEETLQSPTIVVGDDQSLPEAYRNIVYCKLWSPSRALYYLMTGH